MQDKKKKFARQEKDGAKYYVLKQMVKEEPDNLGSLAIGHVDEAIEILLEAERRTLKVPMNRTAESYVILIKSYMLKDEIELAEQACTKVIQKVPDSLDFYYLLGRIK